MDLFRIAVSKDGNQFAAAHFITYDDGRPEPLHGHNYRIAATLSGPLDDHHLVFDFVRLKREIERVAAQLDHRVLLAAHNPALPVERSADGEVVVRSGSDRYVFPARDVVVLDVPNTTAEMIAAWIADRLLERLADEAGRLERIEVELEETTGQSAIVRRELSG
ncbi:MAG: 6-pyruvoyl trahydropterin synthase family protein [Gemmatimonadota bacterium]